MEPKILSDPSKLGGIWVFLHIKAKNAIDNESKEEFINDMKMLYNEFPCAKCRGHIREYMNSHPFEPFYNMKNNEGREIGMFKWSWMFHNAVNTRLYKPYLDWITACEMYELDKERIEPCTHCGISDSKASLSDIEVNNTSDENDKKVDKTKIVQGYFKRK